MLFGVICLAFSPIFVSLAHVNGFAATFYRVTIAATVLLIPFLLQRNTTQPKGGRNLALVIGGAGGLIFAVNNVLFNISVSMIPVANAVFLANTSVIWVGLVSVFFLHERLSSHFWLGVALALAGVFLITYNVSPAAANLTIGNLLALLGGIFYAAYILVNSRARVYLGALSYMVLSNLASSIILFFTLMALGISYTGFSLATYSYLFGLGFISHALGFLAIIYAQAHLSPSRVSAILLSQPFAALILAFILLREQPSGFQLAGMATLFLGIVLANQRRQLRKENIEIYDVNSLERYRE